MMRLKFFLPIAVFVLFLAILFDSLLHDPSKLPSALVGKSIPEFDLPPLSGPQAKPGLKTADLAGKPGIVNFFASWCIPCKAEHPLLLRLAESGTFPIYGINYKDRGDAAAEWLQELGNPYARIGADTEGRVGIDWGIYGVPETFVVDGAGKILYRQPGPLTSTDLETKILPLLKQASK